MPASGPGGMIADSGKIMRRAKKIPIEEQAA
jgi:hypothetical protein